MTIAHTYDGMYAPANPLSFTSGIASLGARIALPIIHLRNSVAIRRFERFSTHLLRDIGFERDWDGSIICGEYR